MRYIFSILLLFCFADAANLLTYNIYERTDRVDIMLSFDSPYEGKISQKKGANITTLNLSDLTYDKLIEKSINSSILQAITIEPNKNSTNVILKSKNNLAVIASKTVDGFGLRIRTKPIGITKNSKQVVTKNISTKTPLETKENEDLIDGRYLSVIFILAIMVIFMYWLKNRVTSKTKQSKNSWLFKSNINNSTSDNVSILHKKAIDNTNSVVLLEFQDKRYLVMTGNSNLLLEKFSKDDIKDDSDFEKAFEDNRKKLDEYLKIQQQEDEKSDYRSKLERY